MNGRKQSIPTFALIIALSSLTANASLIFNFNADPGTPQNVIDGFAAAGNRWSSVFTDDITVNVDIGFTSLPGGVIGNTLGSFVQRDYVDVRSALIAGATSPDDASAYSHLQAGPNYTRVINHTSDNPNGANSATRYSQSLTPVSVTRANAKALGLLGTDPASDGSIRFSSNVAFDFNPADGTTSGQYDFVTVAAHELGHVLGFSSVVDTIEQINGASTGFQLPSTVMDLFRFSTESRALGDGVGDVTADARSKFFSVDGGATSVNGLASGAVYGTGYQASHWAEFTFAGLMDPTIFTGLQRQISAKDKRVFDLIGYKIPEPGAGTIFLMGLMAVKCFGPRRRF